MKIHNPVLEMPRLETRVERRGLIIVKTGNGKGKSTAAFGLAMRAHGRKKRVKIFQFMKVSSAQFGEHRAFKQMGVDVEGLGDGPTWMSRDLEQSAFLALEGWRKALQAIQSEEYFMIVLDEITFPLIYGWIPLQEVVTGLGNKPSSVHVVITGRDCPEEVCDIADIVSDIRDVKHAYQKGMPAQRGIED